MLLFLNERIWVSTLTVIFIRLFPLWRRWTAILEQRLIWGFSLKVITKSEVYVFSFFPYIFAKLILLFLLRPFIAIWRKFLILIIFSFIFFWKHEFRDLIRLIICRYCNFRVKEYEFWAGFYWANLLIFS